METSGIFLFSEPILCVYVDLENLIEQCKLTAEERRVVKYLMLGYSAADIGERLGKTRQTIDVHFKRAVEKICKKNNENWEKTYSHVCKTKELFNI